VSTVREQHVSKIRAIYGWHTYQLHDEGLLLLLLLLFLILMAPLSGLPQSLVVGRLHRTHVHVGVRAGRQRLQVDGDQLLVREQVRFRPAGDREEAAAVPLVLAPLLLIKAAQPLLTSIFLQQKYFSLFRI
jgi:hypothetical protein